MLAFPNPLPFAFELKNVSKTHAVQNVPDQFFLVFWEKKKAKRSERADCPA